MLKTVPKCTVVPAPRRGSDYRRHHCPQSSSVRTAGDDVALATEDNHSDASVTEIDHVGVGQRAATTTISLIAGDYLQRGGSV